MRAWYVLSLYYVVVFDEAFELSFQYKSLFFNENKQSAKSDMNPLRIRFKK